jgi:hypothetical protein
MIGGSVVLGLLVSVGGVPDSGQLPEAIRTAYDANRGALSAFGTIRFREADGELPSTSRPTIDEVAKVDWIRRSPLEGLYVFDGRSARIDHVHTLHDEVARRVKVGEEAWNTPLSSWRALTDGRTTLLDLFGVKDDESDLRHNPRLLNGTERFFQNLEFPLQLGNPQPNSSPPDLGQDLARAAVGRADWTLARVEENVEIDGTRVVKLEFSGAANGRQYWVDLERGAVPLRILDFSNTAGQPMLLWHFDDVRSVGRGWLPFHMILAFLDEQTPDGRVERAFFREKVITEVDFEHHPDRSLFQMEFPEPVPLINITTKVRHDPRRVWDLAAISPAAARRAKPLDMARPQAAPPPLPGARQGRSPWAVPLIGVGVVLVLLSGIIVSRKIAHA